LDTQHHKAKANTVLLTNTFLTIFISVLILYRARFFIELSALETEPKAPIIKLVVSFSDILSDFPRKSLALFSSDASQ
jgi:hypothetical protein